MAHFQFPYRLNAPVSWSQWLVTGLGVALAMGICYRTYRQSGRESTAQLLRPKPPKAGRKLLRNAFRSYGAGWASTPKWSPAT